MEDRVALIAHGYSKDLWSKVNRWLWNKLFITQPTLPPTSLHLQMQQVSMSVKTDGSLSLEENLRQNLLACFEEFSNILHQMAVTHVSTTSKFCPVYIM